MKIIKKYTALMKIRVDIDDNLSLKLSYGDITGPYYSREFPEEEFDTEEEAISYAYKYNKYADWIIIPIIKFDNF